MILGMSSTNTVLKECPGRLPASFFARLGVFVQPNFLDSQACANLRLELDNCSSRSSKIIASSGQSEVDLRQRPAKQFGVSDTTIGWAEQKLVQLQPQLEKFFRNTVCGFETPQFLVYQEGGFHIPHRDKGSKAQEPLYVRRRQFTVVVYLNGEGEYYGGGALTLYGLLDSPDGKRFGFPLIGEEGLLVAFPVQLLHEVTPITFGKRYCIVSHAY